MYSTICININVIYHDLCSAVLYCTNWKINTYLLINFIPNKRFFCPTPMRYFGKIFWNLNNHTATINSPTAPHLKLLVPWNIQITCLLSRVPFIDFWWSGINLRLRVPKQSSYSLYQWIRKYCCNLFLGIRLLDLYNNGIHLHPVNTAFTFCSICVRSFINSGAASQWQWDAVFGQHVRVSPLSQPYNLW